MTYLQKKKLAFMSIVNRIKGFLRTVTGTSSLTLSDCVDDESLVSLSVNGAVGGVGDALNVFDISAITSQQLSNAEIEGNGIKGEAIATPSPVVRIPLPSGSYSISFMRDRNFAIYLSSKDGSGGIIKTIQSSETFANFSFTAPEDGYLRVKWFTTGKISDILIINGTYTETAMPLYIPYGKYGLSFTVNGALGTTKAMITLDEPLGYNVTADVLTLYYSSQTATKFINTEPQQIVDVTSQIDWNSVPQTQAGTTVITATSATLPTGMEATYYSTTKGA